MQSVQAGFAPVAASFTDAFAAVPVLAIPVTNTRRTGRTSRSWGLAREVLWDEGLRGGEVGAHDGSSLVALARRIRLGGARALAGRFGADAEGAVRLREHRAAHGDTVSAFRLAVPHRAVKVGPGGARVGANCARCLDVP